MKGKILGLLGVAALLSSNVFAMEIVGGKLISQKQTSSPEAQFTVKEIKLAPEQLALFNLKSKKSNDQWEQYVYTHVQALDPVADELGRFNLVGMNSLFISNAHSEVPQTFMVKTEICSMILVGEQILQYDRCANNTQYVFLDPKGFASSSNELNLSVNLDPSNRYYELVDIEVRDTAGKVIYSTNDLKPIASNIAK